MTIFCIGRNYSEHAKELKNEIPTQPVVFLKPAGALAVRPPELRLPEITKEVHHEVELVVRVGTALSGAVTEAQALAAVDALSVGVDVTARDLQDLAKAKGLPWTLAKGLRGFAPVGEWLEWRAASAPAWDSARLELWVNGALKQQGSASEMIFTLPVLIRYLAQHFGLSPGDLIFTGTPAGVGPLRAGDQVRARLALDPHERVLEFGVRGHSI